MNTVFDILMTIIVAVIEVVAHSLKLKNKII